MSYHYGAAALRAGRVLEADALWIAGGLYGNPFALASLLEAFAAEPGDKRLVFNGDFHWFDADPAVFGLVNAQVLGFDALRGNVETELAAPTVDAGCGCGYPEWVDQATVDRSNRILERLRGTAARVPGARQVLAGLPMHLRAQVGDARVAIVHGDADGLAGWAFSQEVLGTAAGREAALQAFEVACVGVFASSHSCLPVLQAFAGGRLLINNGSAGMANFAGTQYGVVTRIATRPARRALYEARCADVYVSALAIRFDVSAWVKAFLEAWPGGSDAHTSYYRRIVDGPSGYTPADALQALATSRACG